jgi:hypothetical protein
MARSAVTVFRTVEDRILSASMDSTSAWTSSLSMSPSFRSPSAGLTWSAMACS